VTDGALDVAARRLVLAVMVANGSLRDQNLLEVASEFKNAHLGGKAYFPVTARELEAGAETSYDQLGAVVSKVVAALTATTAATIEPSILELRDTWHRLASGGGDAGPDPKRKALLAVVNAAMLALRPMLIACSTRPGSVEETAIRLLASATVSLPIDQFALADPRAEVGEIAAWLVDTGLATVDPDPEPPAVRATPLGRLVALALSRLEEFLDEADEDNEAQDEQADQ